MPCNIDIKNLANLDQKDMLLMLDLSHRCLSCESEDDFCAILQDLATTLGFEFILYAYSRKTYQNKQDAVIVNVSNPEEWAAEYSKENFLAHDPVCHAMERQIARGIRCDFLPWDCWELTDAEQHVITRRKHYGLNYGFSAFINSAQKDFTFLFSFASKSSKVDNRAEIMSKFLIAHLIATRKKLEILLQTNTLSEKEREIAHHLITGKNNRQIATLAGTTQHTIKFHLSNIFVKLQVVNRQQAIAVLLAERYLDT